MFSTIFKQLKLVRQTRKKLRVFCVDHNSVLLDIKKEFEVVDRIEDADRVLLWNDVNPVERGIIRLARSLKIPVINIQHGRKGTSKYYAPFNEKIQADRLLVWGEFDRKSLVQAGHSAGRIRVTGTTVLSHLQPRKKHKGTNVVFCPEHWDRPVQENEAVKKELQKIKGVRVVTKLIDSPSHVGEWQNPVLSYRNQEDHLSICAEVLSTADLVVGISESTFELLAQAMDIPVVIVEDWEPKTFGGDNRYFTYRRVISPAAKRTSVQNLLATIKDQLKNPDELKKERAKVAIDEGGTNLNAIKEIKKAIIEL